MSEKEEKRGEDLISLIPESDRGDVMTLRFVLKSVTEFLRDIKEPLADLMKTLGASLDGRKIGEEVAAFYESLREANMPEDLAAKMTQEYF
nr:hypothetical protein [Desulfurococcales archaeon]